MQNLQVIQSRGMNVLTSKQIADWYGTTTEIIKKNFSNNRKKYIEGKHYIALSGDELKAFKKQVNNLPVVNNQVKKVHLVANRTSHLYLWTEKGALLHAKSLNTDKAWEVYEYLVDFYFRAKEQGKDSTNQLPERKTPSKMVVDAPENIKIQKAMQEVRDRMTAINVMLDEGNEYCSEEKYEKTMGSISDLWISLGKRIVNLENIQPETIEKKF